MSLPDISVGLVTIAGPADSLSLPVAVTVTVLVNLTIRYQISEISEISRPLTGGGIYLREGVVMSLL